MSSGIGRGYWRGDTPNSLKYHCCTGIGWIWNMWVPPPATCIAYAVVLFVLFSLFLRLHEEPRLTREFGIEYAAYVAPVGRWLPRRPRGRVT